ncbi:helix-turn-helix transcriptional regulator [Orbus wheelerorum]|uniref:helix-turn-helix domain-containing protein n=1 Tax=Orbus wheelerorum TaxID=3074111 RepID=UPI00370D8EAD
MDENADVIAMLCRRIKIARIEKNLSQIELAELAEVGIATIKRIELGESITLLTLISVLRGLDELDQLNNLLAHNERKGKIQKNSRQRKRKIKSQEDIPDKEIISNDFITSQLNNMHWKY